MIELLMGMCFGCGVTLLALRIIDDRREKKYLREHNVTEECIEAI